MKKLSLTFLMALNLGLAAQNHELKKLWETGPSFKVPESVLYHKASGTLFVSNIDGNSNEKDGKGSVGKMTADGKNLVVDWVSGLNAPKGMGIYNDMLYVADVDEVIAIDIKKGSIVLRIPVAGALFLNDITVDQKGIVFVSDMQKGTVHRIENGKAMLFLEHVDAVNGLYSSGEELYLVAKGVMWKTGKNKELIKVAVGMDESTDGIEKTRDNDFLVSCWSGIIYFVSSTGKVQQLLDTRAQKSNTADIGFDPDNNLLFVPTFFGNRVAAYQFK